MLDLHKRHLVILWNSLWESTSFYVPSSMGCIVWSQCVSESYVAGMAYRLIFNRYRYMIFLLQPISDIFNDSFATDIRYFQPWNSIRYRYPIFEKMPIFADIRYIGKLICHLCHVVHHSTELRCAPLTCVFHIPRILVEN